MWTNLCLCFKTEWNTFLEVPLTCLLWSCLSCKRAVQKGASALGGSKFGNHRQIRSCQLSWLNLGQTELERDNSLFFQDRRKKLHHTHKNSNRLLWSLKWLIWSGRGQKPAQRAHFVIVRNCHFPFLFGKVATFLLAQAKPKRCFCPIF